MDTGSNGLVAMYPKNVPQRNNFINVSVSEVTDPALSYLSEVREGEGAGWDTKARLYRLDEQLMLPFEGMHNLAGQLANVPLGFSRLHGEQRASRPI